MAEQHQNPIIRLAHMWKAGRLVEKNLEKSIDLLRKSLSDEEEHANAIYWTTNFVIFLSIVGLLALVAWLFL